MKREWLMAVGVVLVTLVSGIVLIRWFAPQLLGIPLDLQMVRASKEVPPFYENVFRLEDVESREALLKDPLTNLRGRPMFVDVTGYGPHDLLGFRNNGIPNVADVVAIGDSQTYGNQTVLAQTWPSRLEAGLPDRHPTVYSMALGGWGAVQYLQMFTYATFFRPRVIVVAFYSGNDAEESVALAYAADRWASLRPEAKLDMSDRPRFPGSPLPASEMWTVTFKRGLSTVFTPSLRLVSNDNRHATVRAGYKIMERVGQLMAKTAAQANIHLILTVIPTKELVYAPRVQREGIAPTADYTRLVEMERANIDALAQSFRQLANVDYVDLVSALQQAALGNQALYRADANGHPIEVGNQLIAQTLALVVRRYLPAPPQGLVSIQARDGEAFLFAQRGGLWSFASKALVVQNGWNPQQAHRVDARDVAALPLIGRIEVADPARFGPQALGPASIRGRAD